MSFYKQFDEIREEMKELYRTSETDFILPFSSGKDSSMVLTLFWEMLLSLPLEERTKKVHVVSASTLVETPMMEAFLRKSVASIQRKANQLGFPITTHLIEPRMVDRYFFNICGRGLTPPTKKKKSFRWCTDRLKINPMDKAIKEILKECPISFGEPYSAYMLLGSRNDESTSRKESIDKFAEGEESKFSRHAKYNKIRVYLPNKFLHSDALWGYFSGLDELPWGISTAELESFYPEDIFECQLKVGSQGNPCTGGRNGCWTCTLMDEDKMLQREIDAGNKNMSYLYEWKKLLMEMRNDARYRESLKKNEMKKTNKRLLSQQAQEQYMDLFAFDSNQTVESMRLRDYENFQAAYDEDCQYAPGPFTFEARKLLLQKLRYVEKQTGYELIRQEEINAILECWASEGYHVTMNELTPFDWQYDGALVYKEDWSTNRKETTVEHPQFWVHQDFDLGRDELVELINKRQRDTGKAFQYALYTFDYGEEEMYAWNISEFLVCQEGVNTYEEAVKVIKEFLYPPPVLGEFDWESFYDRNPHIQRSDDKTIDVDYTYCSDDFNEQLSRLRESYESKQKQESYVPAMGETENGQLYFVL